MHFLHATQKRTTEVSPSGQQADSEGLVAYLHILSAPQLGLHVTIVGSEGQAGRPSLASSAITS